jgi:hypothetical protein
MHIRFAQMLELEAEGAVQNAEGETMRDFVPRIYLQATTHAKVPRTGRHQCSLLQEEVGLGRG